MPRVKRNNAAGSFTIEPHRLSNEAQVKLCDVLSLKDVYRVPDSILRQFPEAELAWPTNAPRKGVIQRARSGELVAAKPESGQTLYPVKERHDLPPRFMRVRAPNTVNGELTEQSLPTEAGKVLTEIENALGLYLTGAQHLDNTPRPAHYVAEFDPVAKSARKLFDTLTEWSDFYTWQLINRIGAEGLAEIEAALVSLAGAARSVVADLKGRSSKGARRENALCETIKRLRRIFRDHYRGPVTNRRRQGAFQTPSEQESRELEFLMITLKDARISTEHKRNQQKIKRYLRDSRCALPHERAQVLERIAKKVDLARDPQK